MPRAPKSKASKAPVTATNPTTTTPSAVVKNDAKPGTVVSAPAQIPEATPGQQLERAAVPGTVQAKPANRTPRCPYCLEQKSTSHSARHQSTCYLKKPSARRPRSMEWKQRMQSLDDEWIALYGDSDDERQREKDLAIYGPMGSGFYGSRSGGGTLFAGCWTVDGDMFASPALGPDDLEPAPVPIPVPTGTSTANPNAAMTTVSTSLKANAALMLLASETIATAPVAGPSSASSSIPQAKPKRKSTAGDDDEYEMCSYVKRKMARYGPFE